MYFLNMSIDEILAVIDDEVGKKITARILKTFIDNGLTYKVNANYRVYCYIKKSKEAIIINLKDKNGCGNFNFQLRIKDWRTFDKLDEYTENVRKAILDDSYACKGAKCSNDGSEYVFTYHGKEYRLCHMMCNNFWFRQLYESDIDSIMDIIYNEIIFDRPKTRKG